MPDHEVLRVLVVDDEPLGCRRILNLLKHEAGVEVLGTAEDGDAAVEAIRTLDPDLVFLDIQMPRRTGLEVVEEVGPEHMPVTVFVTAYDQFAIRAFDLAAVDYLVKPFDNERFEHAFRRARRKVELERVESVQVRIRALLARAAAPQPQEPPAARYLERIAVPMRGRTRVVPVDEIDCVTASGAYVELHVGKSRYLVRESMQRLEAQLDPAVFLRVHRSAMVHVGRVVALLRSEGGEYHVQLSGGATLRVSRYRREELEQRLGKLR